MFGNTCLLGVANLFTKVLSFLTLPFFTAWLAPEAYGLVDILLTTAMLLLPLVTLNAAEAVFRFLVKGEDARAVLSAALCFFILGGGALLLFTPLLSLLPLPRGYLFCLLWLVAASALHSLLVHILRAQGRYRLLAVQQILCAAVTVTLQIVGIRVAHLGALGYLFGVILGDFLTALFLLFPLLRHNKRAKMLAKPTLLPQMLAYALPLVPTAALWWADAVLDRYMLRHFHGAGAVGTYAAAGKLPALLTLATGVFLEAWHYAMARTGEGERGKVFAHIYHLFLPCVVLAAVLLMFLGKWLLALLFAPAYAGAILPLPYLALSALFAALSQFLGSAFTTAMHTGKALSTSLAAIALNAVCNALLIPRFGVAGAAFATFFAYLVLFFLRYFRLPYRPALRGATVRLALALPWLLAGALAMEKITWLSRSCLLVALLPFAGLLWESAAFLCRRACRCLSSLKKCRKSE